MLLTKEPVAAFKTTSNGAIVLFHWNKNSFLLKLNSMHQKLKVKSNFARCGSLAGPVCAPYSLVIMVMHKAPWNHLSFIHKDKTSQLTSEHIHYSGCSNFISTVFFEHVIFLREENIFRRPLSNP